LNIVHIGNAGVGTGITNGLKKLGHNSKVIVEKPHPFGFKEDIIIFPNKTPSHFKALRIIKTILSQKDVDVFHVHLLSSPVYNILRIRNAKRVYHYHSSSHNQYEPDPPKGMYHAKFVAVPTRIKIIKDAVWIPLPVDTEIKRISQFKEENKEIVVGVGSNFSDKTKGKFLRMDLVNKAIENLQSKGYKIKTLEFKGYRQDNILQYWKKIDIWLDRFHLGFYGFTTPEAASCSIPVLCEIYDDYEQYIPECPFIRMKPEVSNIESNLEYLISKTNRDYLGKKCREYAIQKHDIVKVAEKCLQEYKKILE
jgi:hypothetical protein